MIQIFDCEVFAYDWFFVFKDLETKEYTVVHNDNEARPDGNMDKLAAALDRLTVFLAEKEKAPLDAGTSV